MITKRNENFVVTDLKNSAQKVFKSVTAKFLFLFAMVRVLLSFACFNENAIKFLIVIGSSVRQFVT